MPGFIKKYAKGIVAAIGYVATIATALGLQHYHYVSVVLGVLATVAVVLTKNSVKAPA